MGHWEEVDHTADVALHVWGDDLEDLFATAARGMFSLVAVPDVEGEPGTVTIALTALDAELLLVDWLNELLYLAETRSAVFTEFEFEQCQRTQLRAEARGYPVGRTRGYIKAATYHNLRITDTGHGLEAEIVFDV